MIMYNLITLISDKWVNINDATKGFDLLYFY